MQRQPEEHNQHLHYHKNFSSQKVLKESVTA